MENSSQSSTNSPMPLGCGPLSQMSVHVSPTTGGEFFFTVEPDISVDSFKKMVAKRIKVPRDRISLLFRDKLLQEGNLVQHGVADGSKITLLPNVETGLITQRPEIGIMQALESLNDTQVNEFLCGKAPLNLSMRLGDHMMLIQLQLSTVSGTKPPVVAPPSPSSSPPSLLQASRNLQHTLKRLSADVFSGRDKGRRESVYSGTFSGALNPALQDPKGRPRRNVATIVHILNDLLCSVPEFRRVNRKGGGSEEAAGVTEQEAEEAGTSSATVAPCSDDQNLRTRGKLEHLRLVMGERRERRRQRKQKPYTLPASDSTDTTVIA